VRAGVALGGVEHAHRTGVSQRPQRGSPEISDLRAVTGTFIVEFFFAVPGLGRYFIVSIGNRDYPVIMGTSLLFGAVIMSANVLVDMLYSWIDPRIRRE
jgi:ABC-type dipeptide/oligopeptide/nickel transport system permease component